MSQLRFISILSTTSSVPFPLHNLFALHPNRHRQLTGRVFEKRERDEEDEIRQKKEKCSRKNM